MVWLCETLDGLSSRQLMLLLKLRQSVFIVEQRCLYEDIDGIDQRCYHLAYMPDGSDTVVACARLYSHLESECHIGRVAVDKDYRHAGLGRELMRRAIAQCLNIWPAKPIVISAQEHLQAFYRSLGFSTVSDTYMEDGIAHVRMCRTDTQQNIVQL